MTWHLFLDESGDLGFDWENKGASRYLTITLLAVSQPKSAQAIRNAVTKTLRRKVNTRKKHAQELKGTSTAIEVKKYFYHLIEDEKFSLYSMTLNKRKVYQELWGTSHHKDRLYNFIAQQVIKKIPFEKADAGVELVVDKSKSKKGIADFNAYLEDQLQGRLPPTVRFNIRHAQSHVDLGLSAVDLFCWGIFRKYEKSDSEWFDCFAKKVQLDGQYLFGPQ